MRDGVEVKLRTAEEHFLRANGGLPPEWILWDMEAVDSAAKKNQQELMDDECHTLESIMSSPRYSSEEELELEDTTEQVNERLIYYNLMDENGDVAEEEEAVERPCFRFTGNEVGELKQKLAQETGLRDFIVCWRNPFDDKLYSLKLCLPPSNHTMHVFVVPSASKGQF
uniref:Uncharacterized protein n=1 Tax=Kalanchoe fedtschenkoi TaxID=63787 RepID=A0A7N0ZZ81_KALFE